MNTKKPKSSLNHPEIAEILGAFTGDGWIENREKGFYIMGSPTEDKDYYDDFLSKLFSKHFIQVTPKKVIPWKVYGIFTYRKKIIAKALKLGFQKGKKCLNATIPTSILKTQNKQVIKAFLRGLFDTDGSFWCDKSRAKTSTEWKRTYNYHPELSIVSCSKQLLEQSSYLLNKLGIESKVSLKQKAGIKCNRKINNSYRLRIRKIAEIEKWFDLIGSNNPRHQTRHAVWQKLGYLPPKTTIEERKKILNKLFSNYKKVL